MKIYIFLMLMCFGLFVQAQFVTIPDANFRAALIARYPTCFNANHEMDTTCSEIVSEDSLIVQALNIANLDGIQYFDGLEFLNCSYNDLTHILSLPSSLQHLSCSNNQLSSLPSLPSSLQYLYCSYNQLNNLQALPLSLQYLHCNNNQLNSLASLPSSMQYLNCGQNQLNNLPTLPSSLKHLLCYNNKLTSLPTLPSFLLTLYCMYNQLISLPSLPSSLQTLYCYNNQLSNLASLPSSLQNLYCGYNQLNNLPALPLSLQYLHCNNNQLLTLPTLPINLRSLNCIENQISNIPSLPDSLKTLNCSINPISYLPSLPDSLIILECFNNQLNNLPVLPSTLRLLKCYNNNLSYLPSLPNSLVDLQSSNNSLLSCLPILPQSLEWLQVHNTSITCLPNLPPNLEASQPLPICPNGSTCEPKPTASGIVFRDINANGIFDLGIDSVLTGWNITNSNGWSAVSMHNGEYQIKLDSGIVNTITLTPLMVYAQSTPINYQITPNSNGSQGSNFNFAVNFMPNVQDLRVDLTAGPARPGFNQWCSATINNVGTLNVPNATLKVLKPSTFNFLNANTPVSQQIGDTLIWNNINLNALSSTNFDMIWNVPSNATLDTLYQIQAWVITTLNDSTPSNNYTQFNDIIRASYDPNDKAVNISQLDPDNLDQELKYTIRFQNTGTDTAFTVIIRDTLSNHLDMSTFKILGASHPYSFIVRDHGLLEVFFQNILLPDSFTNEPQSHGFVQYVAKPKSTLQIGDQILNTALIYFDFNTPVVTNTVVTEMKSVSREHSSHLNAQIYPNPSNGKIRIELASNELTSLTICDLTGKVLLEKSVSNGSEIDLQQLTKGLYLVKLENKSIMKIVKLVRE